MMKMIDIKDILLFHDKLIEKTGGSNGVRDAGLIESALNRANVTFDGNDLYESILDKISAITVSIVKNHGFIDGNKRIGIATMLLLLRLNDLYIEYTQAELIDLGLKIASGIINERTTKEWILEHMKNKA